MMIVNFVGNKLCIGCKLVAEIKNYNKLGLGLFLINSKTKLKPL